MARKKVTDTPVNSPLPSFGKYLMRLRINKGIKTQADMVVQLSNRGIKASQGLIAQYETGRIADPNPTILRAIAEIYEEPLEKLVQELIVEKYGVTRTLTNQAHVADHAHITIRFPTNTVQIIFDRVEDAQRILATIISLLPQN